DQPVPAEFNAALYQWEQSYFFENCLGRYFKIEQNKIDSLEALSAFGEIAEKLAQLPRVLVHRAFHSQNILLRDATIDASPRRLRVSRSGKRSQTFSAAHSESGQLLARSRRRNRRSRFIQKIAG